MTERQRLWKDQYRRSVKDLWKISTNLVLNKIKASSGEVDELFKLNFIVLMSTVLISSHANNHVNQELLTFDLNFDNCRQYNWCAYVIHHLKAARIAWKGEQSFFIRSLAFLCLLYVDRVVHKGALVVERRSPAHRMWTDKELKARKDFEMKNKLIGKGSVREDIDQQDEQQQQEQHQQHQQQQQEEESEEVDPLNELETRAGELRHAMARYNEMYTICAALQIDMQIDSQRVHEINSSIVQLYQIHNPCGKADDDVSTATMHTTTQSPPQSPRFDSGSITFSQLEQLSQEVAASTRKNLPPSPAQSTKLLHQSPPHPPQSVLDMGQETPVTPALDSMEFHSEDLRTVEKLEELVKQGTTANPHPTLPTCQLFKEVDVVEIALQAAKFLDELVEKDEKVQQDEQQQIKKIGKTPTFDLGISRVEQKCSTAAEQQIEVVEKRRSKSTIIMKSPYKQRVVDINTNISMEEILLFNWLQGGQALKNIYFIFESDDSFVELDQIKSMIPGVELDSSMIDLWVSMLNELEKYRAPESPYRLFCPTQVTYKNLGEGDGGSDQQKYQRFAEKMDILLNNFPDVKLTDYDMAFFPGHAHQHYYIFVYDLRVPLLYILDNSALGEKDKYKDHQYKLHMWFYDFLKSKGHPKAAEIAKVQSCRRGMKWRTKYNKIDCGIFVMRHLETYMGGGVKGWHAGLNKESPAQDKQLQLRKRYTHRMLMHESNKHRDEIVTAAAQYNEEKKRTQKEVS